MQIEHGLMFHSTHYMNFKVNVNAIENHRIFNNRSSANNLNLWIFINFKNNFSDNLLSQSLDCNKNPVLPTTHLAGTSTVIFVHTTCGLYHFLHENGCWWPVLQPRWVRGIRRCGVYQLLKLWICAGYMCVWVICICGVYVQKYG